jgi:carboxyl-terminal processing protease
VLTHLFTVSAAENFTLAMRALPYVVHMGSTTSGAYANTVTCELLNGWTYVIPIGLFRTIDNICYEGIGITPDVIITNTEADINAGRDLVLEAAISAL